MDYNEAIAPLDLRRVSDDFAHALAISKASTLDEPLLVITEAPEFDFEDGLAMTDGFNSVVISVNSGALEVRTLIALLTTLDAAAVADLTTMNQTELSQLRDEIWIHSSERGDYQALLANSSVSTRGLVGVIIGAAQRELVTVIEGVDAFAAALLAQRIAFRSIERLLVAQSPQDPAAQEAHRRLRLPIVMATNVPRNAALVAIKHLQATLSLTQGD